MKNTKIDISQNLHFLIGDIIGIERYKVNINEKSVRCDSVEDIEKVTKFINFLSKVCNVNAPKKNANSVMNCIEEIYGQKIDTVLGLTIEQIKWMLDFFRENDYHPEDSDFNVKIKHRRIT